MAHGSTDITPELVRELLREQFPHLADRPVRLGARGWDNQMWRVGDDLAVRLPWATDSADAHLRKEHAWLPRLAPRFPLPIPVPQHLGEPTDRFPRPWIITTWVPGRPADQAPITHAAQAADALAAFLTALHQPAPDDAPRTRNDRGTPLTVHASAFAEGLKAVTELGLLPNPEAVRAVWDDAVTAPRWTGPPLWLHADLHPANVLTTDGALSGVIDFGDLCTGDPACDLAAAWNLLPDGAATRLLTTYEPAPDEATVRRARGWAVLRALGGLLIGEAGLRGRPGGKPTWAPPAQAALRRLAT
ncbi:aminoglycoside phosphotransferase family protein [Spirillospora sp. NPDC052269]